MSNQVLEAIEKRSSARAYSDTALTKEELDAILEAGLQAPTATNKKEIHFSVVPGDNNVLEEIEAEKNTARRNKVP